MKILSYKEGMTEEEQKNVGYFERNMLAVLMANRENEMCDKLGEPRTCGWYYDTENNWEGWMRVISISNGQLTFHIPDDFEIGTLPEIEPNWDGHTTEAKWMSVMDYCNIPID